MSTQVFLGNPPANIKQWIIDHYTPPTPAAEPLCFTAVGSDMTVKYANDYDYSGGMQQAGINFQYSTDGKNWNEWALGETQFDPISIPVGTKLYLRGNNPNGVYSPNGPADEHFTFTGSGTINASGNIQSLIDPTMERTDVPENCCRGMFNGCSSLTQAPALPATTLASSCYSGMFSGCTSLTQAPTIKTYTPNLQAFDSMLNMYTNAWGQLTSCNWPDLTIAEAESMVLREHIFGYDNLGEGVRISITCKDGSVTAHSDPKNWTWVFEH